MVPFLLAAAAGLSFPGADGTGIALRTVPRSEVQDGSLRGYRIGYYPPSRGAVRGLPAGFIEITPKSRGIAVSRHFKLGDFARPGEKRAFILLSGLLVEKLELAIASLRKRGIAADRLRIMSGYRSPSYNAKIGNRTTLSRHTYGDAADVLAEDWDRDGRITRKDAKILFDVFDSLDGTTKLTGGGAIYPPAGGHTWMVHTDTRGQKIRW